MQPSTCIALWQPGSLVNADAADAASGASLQTLSSAAQRQAAHQDGLAVLEGEDLLGIQTVHLQEAMEHYLKPPCTSAAGTERVAGVRVMVSQMSACGALPRYYCWGDTAQQLTSTVQSSEQLATNSTVSSKLRSCTAPLWTLNWLTCTRQGTMQQWHLARAMEWQPAMTFETMHE